MPKSYTANFKEKTNSTSGYEPVYLLEITHPQLAQPVRIVRDTENLTSNGNLYVAVPFDISLPDEMTGKSPRAQLRVDNVGRELTQWIDGSYGGRGAVVRIMQVMRDTPNVVEYDITCDVLAIGQNAATIMIEIGYENILDMPALAISYRPDTAPGLF